MTGGIDDRDGVLVLGAGELGRPMLRALSHCRTPETRLSVLLRPSSPDDAAASSRRNEFRRSGIDCMVGDVATSTVSQLADLFRNVGTVVCCTGFVGGPGTQRKITEAVLLAGVRRYVPWQFGVDYDVIGRGSGQPVWDEQLDVRDMLRAQTRTDWVVVSTGMFTPFLFEPAFGVVDLSKPAVRALGDWDRRITVTTPDDIGRLTAAILAYRPRIGGSVVHIAGDTLSYRDLASTVEAVVGRRVVRDLWTHAQLSAASRDAPDDTMAHYRLAFARDSGVAWPMERTFNLRQGIDVVDVRQWLTRRLPDVASATI